MSPPRPQRSQRRPPDDPILWPDVERRVLTRRSVSRNLRFVVTDGSEGDVWNVLGDRTRRTILECLVDRPLAVVEIAERLPVSRPAVSQHLKVLKDHGL